MVERLKHLSIEKMIVLGLGAALLLLIGIGWISYRSTDGLIDRETRVEHTHHVREAIEHLRYLVGEIENTQRLDLLTGEGQYRQLDREAAHKIEGLLQNLTDLLFDDQAQYVHLVALRRLIDLRLAQLQETIDLRNAGRIAADEQRVRLRAGKETMDQILMVLSAMQEQEQTLLTAWSKQADQAASFMLAFIVGGTVLTIGLALGGGALIFYGLSKRRQAEQDALASQARQALVLRALQVVMYSAKPSGDFGALWVSDNIETLSGFPAGLFLEDSSLWMSRIHPFDLKAVLGEFESLPQNGELETEYRWQTRGGEYRWFRDEAMLIRGPDGTPQEIIGRWTDITGRRQADDLIRRQADIIEHIQETVITVDLNGYVTSWNQGAERLLGYSAKEAFGRHISFVYPVEDRAFVEREVLAPAKAKGAHQVEVRRLTKFGDVRFAQLSLTLQRGETGDPIGIVGYSMDITERKRSEESLRTSRNQLQALAARLESVREEERTRIALEIHDDLGQALTGLKLDVAWVHKRIAESFDPARQAGVLARLASAQEFLDSTIQSVRDIATALRPGVLDALGLEAAVEWQAREFSRRTGILCETTIRPPHIVVGPEPSTALFRILQEVLTNVVRHANATRVHIRLEEIGEGVTLHVTDNGKGITDLDLSGPTSFGLLGMRLRAEQQGGTFDIQGTPEAGTTVTVRIPLYRIGDD